MQAAGQQPSSAKMQEEKAHRPIEGQPSGVIPTEGVRMRTRPYALRRRDARDIRPARSGYALVNSTKAIISKSSAPTLIIPWH